MNTLTRSASDRVIAGVCGGLAQYLRMDPLLVRILFLVLGIMTGMGVVLYFVLWILVPAEHATFATREEMMRHNVDEIRNRAQHLGRGAEDALDNTWDASRRAGDRFLYVGAALVAIGLIVLLRNLGLLVWLNRLWPLVLIALGVLILVNRTRDRA